MWLLLLAAGIAAACDECVVIDISHWNPDVDLDQVKAAGIQGVIHKATQGTGYVDPDYGERSLAAEAVDLLWGAYHFGDGSNGTAQAYHFLATVSPMERTLLALDLEENDSEMDLATAEEFVSAVYKQVNKYPFVYGSSYLKRLVKGKETVLTECPLWLAQWGPTPQLPDGWTNWTLWQYSDGRSGPMPYPVPGAGHVDRDRYNSFLHPSLQHMWYSKVSL